MLFFRVSGSDSELHCENFLPVKEKERMRKSELSLVSLFFIALIKSAVWIDFHFYKPQQEGHKTVIDARYDDKLLLFFLNHIAISFMRSVCVIITDNNYR